MGPGENRDPQLYPAPAVPCPTRKTPYLYSITYQKAWWRGRGTRNSCHCGKNNVSYYTQKLVGMVGLEHEYSITVSLKKTHLLKKQVLTLRDLHDDGSWRWGWWMWRRHSFRNSGPGAGASDSGHREPVKTMKMKVAHYKLLGMRSLVRIQHPYNDPGVIQDNCVWKTVKSQASGETYTGNRIYHHNFLVRIAYNWDLF